jgi:Phosphotransferase enzyme family
MIHRMEIDLDQLSQAAGHEVTTFTVEEIEPELRLHSVTAGVSRVRGDDFSLVIKVIQNLVDPDPLAIWTAGAEPEHRNYWKREWLAYSTGLLDTLPGELRAPRTIMTTQPSPDECWIWMEDVEGRPGAEWELDDYDSVAFDLATTQAAYASGRSILPSEPWLSRQWLRSWVDAAAPHQSGLDDDAAWTLDGLAPLEALRPRLRQLWQAREELLAIVESAPPTVVHCDFWPRNLVAADDGTTVALDWSQFGIGALGQDLDQLTLDPVWMLVLPDVAPTDLEEHVLPGYLSGLRSCAIDVDAHSLSRWYAAAASVRYVPMAAVQAVNSSRPEIVAAAERRFDLPYSSIMAAKARVILRALELGESVLNGR